MQSFGSILSLTPQKLKAWWQSLSKDEMEKVCTLDIPYIMSDLVNVANNALVVCKLNHTYKKKDLISWTKLKDDEGAISSQTFEFNLKGKGLLDDPLAELFSSFSISMTAQSQKQQGCPSYRDDSSKTSLKSSICVKKEKLDFILDLLPSAVPNFGDGPKFLFQRSDFLELYSFYVSNPSQHVTSNLPLPPYIQTLFDRLYMFSSLLEYQINFAYFEFTTSYPSGPQLKTSEITSPSISTITNEYDHDGPSNMKVRTVSQLENDSQAPEPLGDQNTSSTASGSPRNLVALNSSQTINVEELNQRLYQRPTKENSSCSGPRELSNSYCQGDMRPRAYEELTHQSSRTSSVIGNEEQEQFDYMYQGCVVGDLQISFDHVDAGLMIDDEDLKEEGEGQEDRGSGCIHEDEDWFENVEELGQALDEKTASDMSQNEDESIYSNSDSFYMPSNTTLNCSQGYPQQQNFYNNEYYPPYYPQQGNMNAPYNNYGSPYMYMPPNNANGPMGNGNYQQMSYPGDNGMYQDYNMQNYEEYESQNGEMMLNEQKSHFYSGRERSKFDGRPKLPPRFQRMRANMFRT